VTICNAENRSKDSPRGFGGKNGGTRAGLFPMYFGFILPYSIPSLICIHLSSVWTCAVGLTSRHVTNSISVVAWLNSA
jgi:hypothetical protein